MPVRWLCTHERLLKKGGQIMTTLTINDVCKKHTPNKIAQSFHNDVCYTFCEVCENNIESFYIEHDSDRLSMWSEWKVSL
jgi:hypothetical protein